MSRLPAMLRATPTDRSRGGHWLRGRPSGWLRLALAGWGWASTPSGWRGRRPTRDPWVDLVAELRPGLRWTLWSVEVAEGAAWWVLETTGWGLEDLRLTARERGGL